MSSALTAVFCCFADVGDGGINCEGVGDGTLGLVVLAAAVTETLAGAGGAAKSGFSVVTVVEVPMTSISFSLDAF